MLSSLVSHYVLFPSPLYFEQEEDGASEIHKAPLVEDSFSFLSLHAWVESQRTGGGRRVGTGELHFEDTFSLWKRAREGRDIPTGMGGGYWLLGVIGLLAWISPVEWVSLSVFHIFNLNRKRLSVLLVRVDCCCTFGLVVSLATTCEDFADGSSPVVMVHSWPEPTKLGETP